MENKKVAVISLIVLFIIVCALVTSGFFSSERKEEILPDESDNVITEENSEKNVTENESQIIDKTQDPDDTEPVLPIDPYVIPDEPYYGKKLNPVKFDDDKWYLTFVNKNYVLPEDYKPQLSEELFGTYCQLDVRCAPYYKEMYNAALKDGCYLTPFSGYRRISTQKRNFENEMQILIRDILLTKPMTKLPQIFCLLQPANTILDLLWI